MKVRRSAAQPPRPLAQLKPERGTLRALAGMLAGSFIALTAGLAGAQPPPELAEAAKPTTYALIAAVGSQFSFVTEIQQTGSRIPPFRRRTNDVPDNLLNKIVLQNLDRVIDTIDPGSRRLLYSLPALQMDAVAASDRESVAISGIVSVLGKMPERLGWDKIVVATPAYRALDAVGLGTRLHGIGLFEQSTCQASCGGSTPQAEARAIASEPIDGVDAITSEDKPIKARTFIAPYSYVALWILDPKTLEVIERKEHFDHQKLAEPVNRPTLDTSDGGVRKYVARRIFDLIGLSVEQGVLRSALNKPGGKAEVGETRDVTPATTKP